MKLLRLGAIFVLVALAVAPVAGQPASTDLISPQLAEDLKGIRSALDRLVALHEVDQRHREVELLLKRIGLRERRLEPLQTRLQYAEVEVRNHEDQLKTLEKMREQHEDLLKEEIKDGTDTPRSETRRMLEDLQRTRKSVSERVEAAEIRLRQLQDEIAEEQEEIEILDEMLTELLEGPSPKSP
jgi:chromosome segregation ATPase